MSAATLPQSDYDVGVCSASLTNPINFAPPTLRLIEFGQGVEAAVRYRIAAEVDSDIVQPAGRFAKFAYDLAIGTHDPAVPDAMDVNDEIALLYARLEGFNPEESPVEFGGVLEELRRLQEIEAQGFLRRAAVHLELPLGAGVSALREARALLADFER